VTSRFACLCTNKSPPIWKTTSAYARLLPSAFDPFFAKHGRPAVLVIDAADYVAKKDPVFFKDVQVDHRPSDAL
jgi:hypothetical protein